MSVTFPNPDAFEDVWLQWVFLVSFTSVSLLWRIYFCLCAHR